MIQLLYFNSNPFQWSHSRKQVGGGVGGKVVYISDIIVQSTPSRELIGDINCKTQTREGWQKCVQICELVVLVQVVAN